MNILITSLPDRKQNISYYRSGSGQGDELFCIGNFSNEANLKYIFSRNDIDRIIAISSNKSLIGVNNYESFNLLPFCEQYSESDVSTSVFYSLCRNLSLFLNNDISDSENQFNLLTSSEKSNLDTVVEVFLNENGVRCAVDFFNNPNLQSTLKNVIRHNLEQGYIDKSDENIQAEYSAIEKCLETDDIADLREYLFGSGIKSKPIHSVRLVYLTAISKLESKISEYINQKVEEIALQYRNIINQLITEINDINSKRLEVEFGYVCWVIFSKTEKSRLITVSSQNYAAKNNLPVVILRTEKDDGTSVSDAEIVSDLLNEIKKDCREGEKINLFVDTQGGSRTDLCVRNSMLSIIQNEPDSNVSVNKYVATGFNFSNGIVNNIVDETKRYDLSTLSIAFNAFYRYGKTDLIRAYYADELTRESYQSDLIKTMEGFDKALSLCSPKEILDYAEKLGGLLYNTIPKDLASDNLFIILVDGLKREYRGIFSGGKPHIINLIEWALKRDFIQQAITLFVECVPDLYEEKFGQDFDDILSMDKTTKYFKKYENDANRKLLLEDFIDTFDLLLAKVKLEGSNYNPDSYRKLKCKYDECNSAKKSVNVIKTFRNKKAVFEIVFDNALPLDKRFELKKDGYKSYGEAYSEIKSNAAVLMGLKKSGDKSEKMISLKNMQKENPDLFNILKYYLSVKMLRNIVDHAHNSANETFVTDAKKAMDLMNKEYNICISTDYDHIVKLLIDAINEHKINPLLK